MIMRQSLFVLAVLILGANTVGAFTVSKPSLMVSTTMTPCFQSSTRLYADETDETEEAREEGGEAPEEEPSTGGAGDILNSPAFLKRKVDVLKSDIAKADEDIAALTEAVEAGKAEWGDQLDKLQAEVRLGGYKKYAHWF
jgi:flagellar motility protein MotE (MotC chaperone)